MPLRIALTGATGFVGKALLPLLLAAGHEVAALVRNPAVVLDPRVQVVFGGLQDDQALRVLTTSVDVVLHVAGVVSGVGRSDFFVPNVEGTLALVKAARQNSVKKFIYVSSLAAREPGLNFYGESKAAAEVALQNFAQDLHLTIVRPAAVYGPGDTATLPLLKSLMSTLALIPGSPSARFGMVHVQDLAQVLSEVITSEFTGTVEIDDGSGGHTWPEVIGVTRSAFGKPSRVVYLPRNAVLGLGFIGDLVAKVRGKPSLLGVGQLRQIYHPDWCVKTAGWPLKTFIPLSKGLPDTIAWYQAQGLLPPHLAVDRRPPSQDKHHD